LIIWFLNICTNTLSYQSLVMERVLIRISVTYLIFSIDDCIFWVWSQNSFSISHAVIIILKFCLIIYSSFFRELSWQIHRLMHINLVVELKAPTSLKQEHFQRSKGLETIHDPKLLFCLLKIVNAAGGHCSTGPW
jgi:hypothetical protein